MALPKITLKDGKEVSISEQMKEQLDKGELNMDQVQEFFDKIYKKPKPAENPPEVAMTLSAIQQAVQSALSLVQIQGLNVSNGDAKAFEMGKIPKQYTGGIDMVLATRIDEIKDLASKL